MPLLENFEKQGNYLFKHRGVLPLFIIVAGFILVYLSPLSSNHLHNDWFKKYELFCFSISFFGFIIRIITVGYIPEGTSGRNTDTQVADRLNQTGMYSIVRHPLYLANFFMWFGISLMVYDFGFSIIMVLIYWIYYERIMFVEEVFLRKKYGSDFLLWATYTPTFIPKLSRWSPPDLPFNFKKVLRQEKNAFLALFIMYFIIDLIRNRNDLTTFIATEWYWTVGLVISLFSYIVLKYLKYKTTLLTDTRS